MKFKLVEDFKNTAQMRAKQFVSKHIAIADKGLEYAIRKILFANDTIIDWVKAEEIIRQNMPETKLEESSNKLEAVLGALTPTQLEYVKEYWNAFYNEPEKYSIYADMIRETMAEKGIE